MYFLFFHAICKNSQVARNYMSAFVQIKIPAPYAIIILESGYGQEREEQIALLW